MHACIIAAAKEAVLTGANTSLIVQVPNTHEDGQNIFVIDNARIHHAGEAELRFELESRAAHARVEYLPPYSPELNPVRTQILALLSCQA